MLLIITNLCVRISARTGRSTGNKGCKHCVYGRYYWKFFAVDNPNKGLYENGEHKEPQYDMNGYTAKIYFDPMYFDFVSSGNTPIDYTVPNIISTKAILVRNWEEVPIEIGYLYIVKE